MVTRSTKLAMLVGAATAALALSTGIPASAYPPGQALTLTTSANQVLKATTITVNIRQAKPGIVTVKFGTTVKRTVASSAYKTPSILFKPSAAGVYIVNAKALDGEQATTRVYVPSRTIATAARVGTVTNAVIRYAKPGSLVKVSVGSEDYYGTVGSAGTAVVPFALENIGSQVVKVTVGTLVLPDATIVGR